MKIHPPAYQTPRTKNASRKDHIWEYRGLDYKCLLCGGITTKSPPPAPTPSWFVPERYEPLTPDERALIPYTIPP